MVALYIWKRIHCTHCYKSDISHYQKLIKFDKIPYSFHTFTGIKVRYYSNYSVISQLFGTDILCFVVGWVWVWTSSVPSICPVLPGGSSGQLNGRLRDRCLPVPQGESTKNQP